MVGTTSNIFGSFRVVWCYEKLQLGRIPASGGTCRRDSIRYVGIWDRVSDHFRGRVFYCSRMLKLVLRPKTKIPPEMKVMPEKRCPIDGGKMERWKGRIFKCTKCGFLGDSK